MKWFLEHKLELGILIGVIIFCLSLFLFLPKELSPQTPAINMTITKITQDDALIAELEALQSKSMALEAEVGGLVLLNITMAAEKNQLLAQVAELRANQRPDLAQEYTALKSKFNYLSLELGYLENSYDALNTKYEVLVNLHAKCGECED